MDPRSSILAIAESKGIWSAPLRLQRQEYLKTGGAADQNIYFINNGALRAFLVNEQEEHTLRFGYTGDIMVAMDSYITGKPSELYIQALKASEVRWMTRDDLMNLLESNPKLFHQWHNALENLILQQMEREHDLLTTSPAERYARVLARSPRLFQEVPHKYIASYLRMTPETLSRLQKS